MSEEQAEYVVKAAVERLVRKYRSKEERVFADLGAFYLTAHYGVQVVDMLYEPVSFKLPGGSYTPDFMAYLADGRVVFVEVKGSRHQRDYNYSVSKLRAAEEIYPVFLWCLALVEKDGIQSMKGVGK